jgi:hypothetical protein
MALSAELAVGQAMDLSQDRIRDDVMAELRCLYRSRSLVIEVKQRSHEMVHFHRDTVLPHGTIRYRVVISCVL